MYTGCRFARTKRPDRQDQSGCVELQWYNARPRSSVRVTPGHPGNEIYGQVLAGPGFSRAANDLRTRVDSYRAVAKLDKGAHQFKAGIEVNRVDLFNLFVQNATGTLYFQNIDALREGQIGRTSCRERGCQSV